MKESFTESAARASAIRNMAVKSCQEAMVEAGWVNPDGYGYCYYHPEIVGPDQSPIVFLAQTAESIQLVREEHEKKEGDHES
jgi:hypothetical protein